MVAFTLRVRLSDKLVFSASSPRRRTAIPRAQPRGDDVVGVGLAQHRQQVALDGLRLGVATEPAQQFRVGVPRRGPIVSHFRRGHDRGPPV